MTNRTKPERERVKIRSVTIPKGVLEDWEILHLEGKIQVKNLSRRVTEVMQKDILQAREGSGSGS